HKSAPHSVVKVVFNTFWKIILEGPADTPYEKGTFELYCQFGTEYPVKPPTVRFVTPIYHCNINNVGRICHNILDRNYNSLITMREILEAVFGLLMHPEPEDPLDSILAEEYITNKESYDQEARKKTEEAAAESLESKEKVNYYSLCCAARQRREKPNLIITVHCDYSVF
uniref:UBC core domain-containing protein n=1 Tax=Xiphophorus maculatus TaxID=8083 RepID=A0A3B5QHH4_XIPMA